MYSYNSSSGIIKFNNGSEIILCELRNLPGDKEYTRLGGLLLTFAIIDEIGEVDEKGYTILKTRVGRWRNEEFGIKPLTIGTCNPIKNWLYREFYKKHIEGTIEEHKMFIQALPTDNPYLPQSYLDNLNKLPYIDRQRLLFGNWEYDDASDALLTYSEIANIWDNIELKENSKKYITADIAFTSDKMVIMVWEGYVIKKIFVNPEVDKIEDFILELAREHNVPNYHIAYDSDGVGQFLKKRLRNAKPIVNNARALKDENYKNLKTQLYYKLAEMVQSNDIKCLVTGYKEEMTDELQQIRHKPTADVSKLEIVSKSEVKKMIGRSPDFSDNMAYRMVFEYGNTNMRTFRII